MAGLSPPQGSQAVENGITWELLTGGAKRGLEGGGGWIDSLSPIYTKQAQQLFISAMPQYVQERRNHS